jgi:hypothetical protein
LFSVSLDLIHHLIEHSDQSTAAKRVQPTGPRKYKRRRKINGDSDNSDFHTVDANLQRVQKTIKQEPVDVDMKKRPNIFDAVFSVTDDISEFKLPDEIFQGIGKRVPVVKEEKRIPTKSSSSSSSRPKMIYTQKTRVAVSDGKRKTKTMIQKQVMQSKSKPPSSRVSRQQQKKKKELFEHDESSETWSNDDPNEDVLDTLMKRERKLSEKFTIDLVNDLQDILRSPLKTNDDDEMDRRSRRGTMSRFGKKRTRESSEEEPEKVFVKQEVLEDGHVCGMCGDSFETRTQLRSHIQIHI